MELQASLDTGFSKKMKMGLAVWSLAALLLVSFGVYERLPIPAVQVTGLATLLALLISYKCSERFREWTLGLSLRGLTLFQSWRVIPGALFLYYYYELGLLDDRFAVIGGWGDIAVGVTALAAAGLAGTESLWKVYALRVWHILALADLILVLRFAVEAALRSDSLMRPLTQLPLGLLPTLLVPITLFAHFVCFRQLRRRQSELTGASGSV